MSGSHQEVWRLYGDLTLPFEGRELMRELGAKQIALLVMLIISGRPVPREELALLLWPGSAPQSARQNLRQALFALRKTLGQRASEILVADSHSVRFDKDALRIDFSRMQDIAAGSDFEIAEVVDLCRGPLLENLAGISPKFDEQLATWRQEAAIVADAAIGRAMSRARPVEVQQLNEKRRLYASFDTSGGGAPASNTRPETTPSQPARKGSWRRSFITLALGLGLGTALVFGTFTVSRDFRAWMRANLLGHQVDAPSIAVRPFRAANDSQVERNLAGGVTVGVTYGLYTVAARDLFVVTVPANADDFDAINAAEYAAELGVRYLISGAVEHDAGSVRVFVTCFDAETGHDIWQNRFTSPVTEAFQLQDDITLRILQGLEIDISSAERNRIQYLEDTENLEAWLFAVKGVSELIQLTPSKLEDAYESYRTALRIDPDYISARRGVVWHALLEVRFGLADDPAASIQEARNHLDVIMRHDAENGMSKAIEGLLLLLEGTWDAAVKAGETASSLLPGSADVWAVLAHTYTFTGEPRKAIAAIDRAMTLSPGHPLFYRWIKARALRQTGDIEAAIAILEQDAPPEEETLVQMVELAVAYSAAGRLEDARAVAQRIRARAPDFSASNWVSHPAIKDQQMQSLEFELLSKAGL
ncbi:hypothetical protein [Silicimonas sp. MF1-12-2]|uniref:hypothetical protein n=1 Tax=Silicimonas sp. MF1-12-2 TaxID=3384793 RepID=UPI0039B41EAA